MKKKSILFVLFMSVFVMNLASQEQCKAYSTDNRSLRVRLSKSKSQIKRDKVNYYKYEVTILSKVDRRLRIESFGLDSGNTKKYKYILENSPVDKVIESMGEFKFDFLSTDGNITASDFNVVAEICE